jgi:toxin FitB
MNFLIDTTIISEIMRKEPDRTVRDWFAGLENLYISVITVDEVFYGLTRKNLVNKISWFQRFLQEKVEVLPVEKAVARYSGEKRGEQEQAGRPGTMADYLIAATAREYGLVLATRNVKDFENLGIALFNPFEG